MSRVTQARIGFGCGFDFLVKLYVAEAVLPGNEAREMSGDYAGSIAVLARISHEGAADGDVACVAC